MEINLIHILVFVSIIALIIALRNIRKEEEPVVDEVQKEEPVVDEVQKDSIIFDEAIKQVKKFIKKEEENSLDKYVNLSAIKKGRLKLRLLPPRKEGEPFFTSSRMHKLYNHMAPIHCGKEMKDGRWKGDCPICKFYSYMWKHQQQKHQNLISQIKPYERYYYNVIIKENGETIGPKILSVGKMLHSIIVDTIADENDVLERNFIIEKQTKGNFPDYSASRFGNFAEDTYEQMQEWKEDSYDLSKLHNCKSKEELEEEVKVLAESINVLYNKEI